MVNLLFATLPLRRSLFQKTGQKIERDVWLVSLDLQLDWREFLLDRDGDDFVAEFFKRLEHIDFDLEWMGSFLAQALERFWWHEVLVHQYQDTQLLHDRFLSVIVDIGVSCRARSAS